MKRLSITWGTCWYNETVDSIIEFLNRSTKVLTKYNFKINLVIFDARYNHNYEEINKVKEVFKDIKIFLNKTNIFPNKNYGVSLITRESKKLKNDYVAIIDSDWEINNMEDFIKEIINDLKDTDIIIPDIQSASGRSNVLIGSTAINIFFPEYKNIICSPFPGAVIAKTNKLYKVISNNKYNFDWGGEWDIIAISLEYKMKISSPKVNVKGVRHRTNKSKMNDSFQIWKSILSNEYVINNIDKNIDKNIDNNDYSNINIYNKLKDINDINNMINILETEEFTKTERQFLYMILYPIAVFYNKINIIKEIKEFEGLPYDKEELTNISSPIYKLTKQIILKEYKNNLNKHESIYYSKWNIINMKEALENYEVVE